MDILRIEEYRALLISYEKCFGFLLPELNLVCSKSVFVIRGQELKYVDITGVALNQTHFIIEVKHNYRFYLPIVENSDFYIEENTIIS